MKRSCYREALQVKFNCVFKLKKNHSRKTQLLKMILRIEKGRARLLEKTNLAIVQIHAC